MSHSARYMRLQHKYGAKGDKPGDLLNRFKEREGKPMRKHKINIGGAIKSLGSKLRSGANIKAFMRERSEAKTSKAQADKVSGAIKKFGAKTVDRALKTPGKARDQFLGLSDYKNGTPGLPPLPTGLTPEQVYEKRKHKGAKHKSDIKCKSCGKAKHKGAC